MSERTTAWSAVYRLVQPNRGKVASLAVVSLTAGLLEAGFLLVVTGTALAISSGDQTVSVVSRDIDLSTVLFIGAALLTMRLVLVVVMALLSTNLILTVSERLRRQLSSSFISASWAVQHNERSGHLQQLLTDFAQKTVSSVNALTAAITAILSLMALVVMALAVNAVATLAVVVVLGVMSSALLPVRRRIRSQADTATGVSLRFGTTVAEYGAMGLEMHAFGRGGAFTTRIHDLIREENSAWRKVDLLKNSVGPIYTSIGYAALLGSLAMASAVGANGLVSISAVVLLMLRCLGYGQTLQTASATIFGSLPYLRVLEQTVERYDAERAPGGGSVIERIGEIEVDGVSFGYDDNSDVIHDLSFEIAAGEAIGIVGPSGGGKSTLVQLLLGLRSPRVGAIRVGGVDLEEVERSQWTSKVAFVPQDALLFSATVGENIAFMRDDLDSEAIVEASRQANLHDDVMAMPLGYDTPVGERGGRLSGGQRQRLAIARALAGRPEMVILDEPTSALDVDSERLVRDTLDLLRGRVTAVVIAHRLTTIEGCDRIMVVENGRMMAFGSAVDLRSNSAFYQRAVELSGLT